MKKSTWILVFGAVSLLGLYSCAHNPVKPSTPSFDTREAVVADGGVQGGRVAAVHIAPAQDGAFQTQTVIHKWVDNDIYQYEASLKYYNGTSYVDFVPALTVVVPRKVTPKTMAVFTNLRQSMKYQVSLTAKGNNGGSAATTVLNSTPATAVFDFTATQDVQDTLSANLQITFDPVPFSGKGTATMLTPADATYSNPVPAESGAPM